MTTPRLRCAIYTRKSSEEGLEQEFNSLHAQRDACEAYIKSQASEGWRVIPSTYDDGGLSGATMERPALQRLLADVDAGLIDTIVVYKIDRLTRSLADFARIVERLDARDVSFVSVTQAFNTTTSMGRLTLNVLLSFAQFEREVTGERIRDKIAASKARGLWMGGLPPLGYDLPEPGSRMLRLNPAEAEVVRMIFSMYRDLGSVHAVQRWLSERGIVSKTYTSRAGRTLGGVPFSRGALFHLLRNRLYLGLIVHKARTYPGEHQPIVTQEQFDATQALLSQHARRKPDQGEPPRTAARALLTGRVFDVDGQPMSPTFARGKSGTLYRYYVSAPFQQGRRRPAGDQAIRRVSAAALEKTLDATLARLLPHIAEPDRLQNLLRVEVHAHTLDLLMPVRLQAALRQQLQSDEVVTPEPGKDNALRVTLPVRFQQRGGRTEVVGAKPERSRCDPGLIRALRRAHAMLSLDEHGLPILETSPASEYWRKLVRLALLAPDLQSAILAGTQPPTLTIRHFIRADVPLIWSAQSQALS